MYFNSFITSTCGVGLLKIELDESLRVKEPSISILTDPFLRLPEILKPARVCVEKVSEIQLVAPILPDIFQSLVSGLRGEKRAFIASLHHL